MSEVSIQVQLCDLQRVLADFDAGYLLTVDPSTAQVKVSPSDRGWTTQC